MVDKKHIPNRSQKICDGLNKRILFRCNLQVDDIKPIVKKSKSLLSKLRKWKPFSVSSKDSGHIFINLSLRVASMSALLCDSEQEFLNLSLRNLEMDTVFHPGSKMIVRTFIHDLLVEDVTQLSLFPKVPYFAKESFLLLKLPLSGQI